MLKDAGLVSAPAQAPAPASTKSDTMLVTRDGNNVRQNLQTLNAAVKKTEELYKKIEENCHVEKSAYEKSVQDFEAALQNMTAKQAALNDRMSQVSKEEKYSKEIERLEMEEDQAYRRVQRDLSEEVCKYRQKFQRILNSDASETQKREQIAHLMKSVNEQMAEAAKLCPALAKVSKIQMLLL